MALSVPGRLRRRAVAQRSRRRPTRPAPSVLANTRSYFVTWLAVVAKSRQGMVRGTCCRQGCFIRLRLGVVMNSALASRLAPVILDIVCACFPLLGLKRRMSLRSWSGPSCYFPWSGVRAACSCRAPWCVDCRGSRAGGVSTTKSTVPIRYADQVAIVGASSILI